MTVVGGWKISKTGKQKQSSKTDTTCKVQFARFSVKQNNKGNQLNLRKESRKLNLSYEANIIWPRDILSTQRTENIE